MLGKILLICLLLISIPQVSYSRIGRTATEAELQRYCVPLEITLDEQVHWFFYKHLEFEDDRGVIVKYGRHLGRRYLLLRETVINYEEAKGIWLKIKEKEG